MIYCGRPGKIPAVMECLLWPSTVCIVSKNTRRVFSIPENIFGVRNFSMIIRSPNATTLSIFIHFNGYEKDSSTVVTTHNTLANYQTAPLISFDYPLALRNEKRFRYIHTLTLLLCFKYCFAIARLV